MNFNKLYNFFKDSNDQKKQKDFCAFTIKIQLKNFVHEK